KRVEFLVGRGLISSEGKLWKRQRQMIQPAFHQQVLMRLTKTIIDINAALLGKWERAALNHQSINVTHDISSMILELVLTSIFSDDYQRVAPQFSVLAEESARNLQFARTFGSLRTVIARVAAERRAERRVSTDFLGMLMG